MKTYMNSMLKNIKDGVMVLFVFFLLFRVFQIFGPLVFMLICIIIFMANPGYFKDM